MPGGRCHPSAEVLPHSKEIFPGFGDATAPSSPPSYSMVLPTSKKKTYGRLIHRHPHLEFLQEWAEKDFRRIGNWQEKPHWSSLAPFLHGCDAWLLPQWQLQSPGCPWTLLAAMLFLEGKGAAVSSPAQSRETFLLCLYWNDPSWWLKIGLRRWRGRTAQEKIGWPMFNQAALKCT